MQTIKVEKLVSEEAGTVKGSSNSYDLVKLDHRHYLVMLGNIYYTEVGWGELEKKKSIG